MHVSVIMYTIKYLKHLTGAGKPPACQQRSQDNPYKTR